MRRLSFLILTIFAVACQTKKSDNVTLEGQIDNVEDGTQIFIAKLAKGGKTEPVDTAEVKNGKFTTKLPKVDFQTLNILRIEDTRGNMLFINENEPMTATVYKDSLRRSKIKGGKANDVFKQYVDHLAEERDKRVALSKKYGQSAIRKDPQVRKKAMAEKARIEKKNIAYRKKLIQDNPNSLAAVFVFSDVLRSKSMSTPEMKKLYEGLSPQVKNTFIAEQINDQLTQRTAVSIGSKAPSFSAKTPEGEELALEDAMGKYTLIDFWASWCKPCRIENPHLVKAYKKYHGDGLNMLGVSLDKKNGRKRWIKAIEDDNLEWPQVSNLQFWNGPIAKQYNVRSIPANFLLDENGKIIAKDLRGATLEKKMEELLNN